MADKTVRGRFVWHELITPDTAGAHAFYTKVLGWRTQAWDLNPDYTMFVAPSGPLGGSVGRPSESAARWRPYIGTDHIEGTVDQARSLGARVVTDVTEMPNAGKYAILEDPQGVEFGVYLSPSDPAPEAAPKLGEYSWHELATNDFRAAFDFYSALFGWEAIAEHDMGAPSGVYLTFGRDGTEIGGMFKRTPEMPGGPAWLGYVRVKDVQQTITKATSIGATLLLGPMEVPGGDFIAQFNDPQGGMFAVHTVAADIQRFASETEAAVTAGEAESTEEQAAATGAARRATAQKAAAKKAKQPAKKAKGAAKKASPAAAKKKTAKKAAKKARKSAAPSRKSAKKKAVGAKAKAGKKTASRKVARGGAKKRATAKGRGAAARGAKRPARKVARGAKSKRAAKKRAPARSRSKTARKAK
ncbi:MAG: hypothetical protein GX535_08240 [Xanthomonadaceae bacterium]|nr:hypothetical protein [Xanthomonadaceae bacterium]